MHPLEIIAAKRDGREHTEGQIRALVSAVADGSMPDYQVAAWLMAARIRGLTHAETLALTLAMRDSGARLDLRALPGVKVDKHSTGGVGDKTTLVVVPILAAAGVPVLKMSGRGLGHTGGTLDKLEAVPGLRTDLTSDAAIDQVRRVGAAIVGQSAELAPADGRLYALRDVTATVDSTPLIAASIMSKKLAAGADALVLDVKAGRGAFMPDEPSARRLARAMVAIGASAGMRVAAAVTAMEEPLGRAVGNALEVAEACAVLTGAGDADDRLVDLCVRLAAEGLRLGGAATTEAAAMALARRLLEGGQAAERLMALLAAQGGDSHVVERPDLLPRALERATARAASAGVVARVDAREVGRVAGLLGAGRARMGDAIDPAAGVLLLRRAGDAVARGEPLAEALGGSAERVREAALRLRSAYALGEPAPRRGIVLGWVRRAGRRAYTTARVARVDGAGARML
ncbi:MAG: thymidine phosphorylase [Chthonomonadales bacterium]|nr:thymidine phosphorylase [Chthonomonadales bacterium]